MNVPPSGSVPGRALHCSPGLQEIFDCWPSMSDLHPGTQTVTPKHASNTMEARALPQPATCMGRKLTVHSGAERAPQLLESSKPDTEKLLERPGSAGDLVPPTQERPPVTPRVKMTTSSFQSPLTAQSLKQSTPSGLHPQHAATPKSDGPQTGLCVTKAASDNEQLTAAFERQPPRSLPQPEITSLPHSAKALLHADLNQSPPRGCDKLLCDPESPVDKGFSLKLSQDTSLCSGSSGTFSIIDVASDRCLFDTFIEEWKTKGRYSLALACEQREQRQQPQGEISGKHKRGNHKPTVITFLHLHYNRL